MPATVQGWMAYAIGIAAIAVFFWFANANLIVNGLFLGGTIALGAIGISLIYGIMRFANIAHGDFMTLGAYVTFFLVTSLFPKIGIEGAGLGPFTFGYPLLIALPITMAIVAALAIALDVLIYRRLRNRGSSFVIMAMTSLGLAIALRGLVQILWGTSPEQYPRVSKAFYRLPFDIRVPPDSIFLAIAAIVLVVALYLFLNRTKTGKAMRATSDNADLARISGINTERVIWWTWAIAAAFAAVAGSLLAVSQAQLLPIMGWKVLIPLFAAVILGGIGNPWGALAGALIIGVSTEVSTEWINPAYKPAIAFTIMLIVLLIRPRGIFRGAI
jgi:branched-chain amino acid transport system permease protein/neutral amino acid transport system permease protein